MLLLLLALQAPDPHLDLGPMVGHAGPSEARIWARASGPARLAVEWSDQEDLSGSATTDAVELTDASAFCGQVRLAPLKPATRYWYRVLLDGRPAMARPWPAFRTAPEPGSKERVRVAFGSCVGRDGRLAAGAWGSMASQRFDLLLMLGDNHYADSTDPAKQRAAYANHRRPAGWADLCRRTPVYAIWDDHDYGPNNSDGTAPGKDASLATFKEWWANPSYGEPGHPGVYHRFRWGDVDVFMLDSRYYRTPNKAPDDGTKTMLGGRQLAWLKEGLASSTATFKLVGCGSEFQTYTQPDGWASFRRERDGILDFIEREKIEGVIFLSGDRHFTAAYQIRGRHLEVTSGPLGSSNAFPKPQPEMLLLHMKGRYYTVFELDPASRTALLEVHEAGLGVVQERLFTWAEITGAAKIPTLGR
ncbi:MAG TPA: alkaline phosphatase D family protein [Planctomycetota bacterium]|nr:alkaline phosphatase D family protein [Planctomycetota bacterium]